MKLWLLNYQNNAQNYFLTEESFYKYSKVSKTILFAIFEFVDLKLLQIYSNHPFEIWIFKLSQIWNLADLKYSTCQGLSKNIKFVKFGVVVKKLWQI